MTLLDSAERRLKALQRIVRAQEMGLMSSPIILTTDRQGATVQGAEALLDREMAERGLEMEDLKAADLTVTHVNLHWAHGRNLRFGDKAAGLCDEDGKDIHGVSKRGDLISRSPDYQSAGLQTQNPEQASVLGNNSGESNALAPSMPP